MQTELQAAHNINVMFSDILAPSMASEDFFNVDATPLFDFDWFIVSEEVFKSHKQAGGICAYAFDKHMIGVSKAA